MRNKDLIKKYPWLQVENPYGPNNWTDCWLDDLEPGWKEAFGEDLCRELDKAIKLDKCQDSFKFVQIKEKFGSLRLYATGYGPCTQEILAKYEQLSKFICGKCGKIATHISEDSWIYPWCDNCLKKLGEIRLTAIKNYYNIPEGSTAEEVVEDIKDCFKYSDYWVTIK